LIRLVDRLQKVLENQRLVDRKGPVESLAEQIEFSLRQQADGDDLQAFRHKLSSSRAYCFNDLTERDVPIVSAAVSTTETDTPLPFAPAALDGRRQLLFIWGGKEATAAALTRNFED
jgi:hypothetical protein